MRASFPLAFLALCGCGTTGYDGPAVRLDGDDDCARVGRVEAGAPLSLAGSPFTVAAWFLQEQGGDPYQRIVDKSDGPYGHHGWALAADGASGQIHLYAHDGARGGDFVSRRRAYETGRWYHVAAVARAGHREIWIDGRLDRGAFYEDGAHALPATVAAEMRLGSWNHAQGREWKGLLGEVAVWRRDLRPAEIVAMARGGGRFDLRQDAGGYAGARDLVGYWRPDGETEGMGLWRDQSSTGAHARLDRGLLPGTP